jgi:hypothetical protein
MCSQMLPACSSKSHRNGPPKRSLRAQKTDWLTAVTALRALLDKAWGLSNLLTYSTLDRQKNTRTFLIFGWLTGLESGIRTFKMDILRKHAKARVVNGNNTVQATDHR